MIFQTSVNQGKLVISEDMREYLASLKDGLKLEVKIVRAVSRRTESQNNALHKYFALVATAMSDAGYTVQHILSQTADMQPTPSFVKRLWQDLQLAVIGERYTRRLQKLEEIDKVYDEFNLFLTEKLWLDSIPFPCKEELVAREEERQWKKNNKTK